MRRPSDTKCTTHILLVPLLRKEGWKERKKRGHEEERGCLITRSDLEDAAAAAANIPTQDRILFFMRYSDGSECCLYLSIIQENLVRLLSGQPSHLNITWKKLWNPQKGQRHLDITMNKEAHSCVLVFLFFRPSVLHLLVWKEQMPLSVGRWGDRVPVLASRGEGCCRRLSLSYLGHWYALGASTGIVGCL